MNIKIVQMCSKWVKWTLILPYSQVNWIPLVFHLFVNHPKTYYVKYNLEKAWYEQYMNMKNSDNNTLGLHIIGYFLPSFPRITIFFGFCRELNTSIWKCKQKRPYSHKIFFQSYWALKLRWKMENFVKIQKPFQKEF